MIQVFGFKLYANIYNIKQPKNISTCSFSFTGVMVWMKSLLLLSFTVDHKSITLKWKSTHVDEPKGVMVIVNVFIQVSLYSSQRELTDLQPYGWLPASRIYSSHIHVYYYALHYHALGDWDGNPVIHKHCAIYNIQQLHSKYTAGIMLREQTFLRILGIIADKKIREILFFRLTHSNVCHTAAQ